MVEEWGTGRRDYSTNVEESVVPIIRSYQINATAYETFTLSPGEQKEIDISMTFEAGAASHFISHIDISVDANVLIYAEIWSGSSPFIFRYGYQCLEIDIPQTLGLSSVKLKIKNYGDVSVNGAYSHNGVQGSEKIMPYTVVV